MTVVSTQRVSCHEECTHAPARAKRVSCNAPSMVNGLPQRAAQTMQRCSAPTLGATESLGVPVIHSRRAST
ncbi:hypothetical protein OAO87_04800, partial [bacterium]|nr:hypothetical protein [bacterium]